MTDDTVGTDGTAKPRPKLNPDQRNALAMHDYWDRETGEFKVQPDQITDTGIMVYDLADPDTDHEDTLLIIYPSGGTAVMTRGMNLPEGVK